MFSIQTNSGKHICGHSYFETEDEILLPPGIYLKVVDVLNSGDGLHIIHLRETPPPFELLAKPFDLGKSASSSKPSKFVVFSWIGKNFCQKNLLSMFCSFTVCPLARF